MPLLTLTHPLENEFEYGEHVLHLDLSFDNVLRMHELFEDELFNAYEKVIVALKMLITDYEKIRGLYYEDQQDIYIFILKEFLGIDVTKEPEEKDNKKVMDWKKDAGLIYASFLSEYGIDLIKVQGLLEWAKFEILLSNLGETTSFKKVVGYRTMKVPTSKEASEDYRKYIQKMKKIHSLEDETTKAKTLENKLDAVASTFSGGGKR